MAGREERGTRVAWVERIDKCGMRIHSRKDGKLDKGGKG